MNKEQKLGLILIIWLLILITLAIPHNQGVSLPQGHSPWHDFFNDPAMDILTLFLLLVGIHQISTTRDIARKQLRAYVTMGDVIIAEQDAVRKDNPEIKLDRYTLKVTFKNLGATPAHKLSAVVMCAKMPYPIPNGTAFDVLTVENKSITTLGAGQFKTATAIANQRFSPEEISQIKQDNNTRLYIWGLITYEDIFENPRHTKFCKFLQWNEGIPHAYAYKDFNEET